MDKKQAALHDNNNPFSSLENKTMRAAVCSAPKSVTIQTIPIREPQPGEVLVKMEGCGICGSNLPVWEGRSWFTYPMEPGAPGHEGWGRVVKAGPDIQDLRAGDRVSLFTQHSFAEFETVSAKSVVKLPDVLDSIPFPGEPLGCAMNIFERSDIQEGQTVAIVGIGFIGALLTALCAQSGARVVAISRRQFALDTARLMGADCFVPLSDTCDTVAKAKSFTGEQGCDRVIESTGLQQPLDIAGELTKVRGRLVIAGYHQDGMRSVNMQLWNWRGIDVINAHEREPERYLDGIRKAADAIATGHLNPRSLFTHKFTLGTLGDAFEMMSVRPDGFIKALLTF